ncbi:putative Glycos_transf_1 domain-containing protein [Gammaproteobacteria bacterium]
MMTNDAGSTDALVITRHFSLRWGGAEHSLAAVIDELQAVRPNWTWTISDGGFDPPNRLRPLPLLQLLLRRSRLRRTAASFQGRLALIQSLVGPTMLNALPSAVVILYFMRDVRYWDEWTNHEVGVRRIAKNLYRMVQLPMVAMFRHEVRRAVMRADLLVANSNFMAERIRIFCGREALIVYPRTPVAALPLPEEGAMVGMIGDGADKGGHILRALANRFPEVTFRLHARRPAALPLPSNVVFAGWESDPARLYHGLRLMLVPSQVAEAYGRVALEALGYGVPVLVSRTGGLVETVPDPTWTVPDYDNPEAWCTAFAETWPLAPSRRTAAHTFAVARQHTVDEQHQRLVGQTLALLAQ